MIESPLLKELMAETIRKTMQSDIVHILVARFGRVARTLRPAIKAIEDNKRLKRLLIQSARCTDLESFQKLLES